MERDFTTRGAIEHPMCKECNVSCEKRNNNIPVPKQFLGAMPPGGSFQGRSNYTPH